MRATEVEGFFRGLGERKCGICDWKETCLAGIGGRLTGDSGVGVAWEAKSATAFLRFTDLGRERRGWSATTGSAGAGRAAGRSGAKHNTMMLYRVFNTGVHDLYNNNRMTHRYDPKCAREVGAHGHHELMEPYPRGQFEVDGEVQVGFGAQPATGAKRGL